MLKHVLLALKDLKKSLQAQGSDLLVGYGPAEDAILKLVNEVVLKMLASCIVA